MRNILFLLRLYFACIDASILTKLKRPVVLFDKPQDVTTSRANTLFDDADDIQRQLDNETRDRIKSGQATSVWVFHYPPAHKWGYATGYRTQPRVVRTKRNVHQKEYYESMEYIAQRPRWNYDNQSAWCHIYPTCSGRSQSPVNLPHSLLKVAGTRHLIFKNHDVLPLSLNMKNDGRTVKMSFKWEPNRRPYVQGGALLGRRYIFDSIHLHWPSEHTIETLHYPVESQALYVSAEYPDLEAALRAKDDNMAMLAMATIYTVGNISHPGINAMMKAALDPVFGGKAMSTEHPLSFYNPPFKEYASYQGSLTIPPCTESVIWLIRAKSLPVTAAHFKKATGMMVNGEELRFIFRQTQHLNDRNVYFFG